MLVVKKEKTPLNKKYDSIARQELSRSNDLSNRYIRVIEESNRLINELARFNKHPMDEARKLLRGE